jgi:hypothetical protein
MWQNDVCIHLSRQLGIEPPPREALARKSFSHRIQIVLDKWMVGFRKDWPEWSKRAAKFSPYHVEIMRPLVFGIKSEEMNACFKTLQANPRELNYQKKVARWASYEYGRLSGVLAAFAVAQTDSEYRNDTLAIYLNRARLSVLGREFEARAKRVKDPELMKALQHRQERLFDEGSPIAYTITQVMGLTPFQCRSFVNAKGQLVLADERVQQKPLVGAWGR